MTAEERNCGGAFCLFVWDLLVCGVFFFDFFFSPPIFPVEGRSNSGSERENSSTADIGQHRKSLVH